MRNLFLQRAEIVLDLHLLNRRDFITYFFYFFCQQAILIRMEFHSSLTLLPFLLPARFLDKDASEFSLWFKSFYLSHLELMVKMQLLTLALIYSRISWKCEIYLPFHWVRAYHKNCHPLTLCFLLSANLRRNASTAGSDLWLRRAPLVLLRKKEEISISRRRIAPGVRGKVRHSPKRIAFKH